MKNIDDVDKKIVAALMENGRIPAKTLAKKLNIHPNTILQRIKRLEKVGIIKDYSANLDYSMLGYDFHVMIMMKMSHSRTRDIEDMKSVLQMKELEAFYATTGIWDVLSLWRVKNKEHLNDILNRITSEPNVVRTMTNTILRTYRSPREFNPVR